MTFDPTLYNASDSVPGVFNGSSSTTPTVMVTRYYGDTGGGPRSHYERVGGTEAAPSNPTSGNIILDEGARVYFSGTLAGSSYARIVYLAENVTSIYSGCYEDTELTEIGSNNRVKARRLDHDGSQISFGTAGDMGKSFTTSGSGRWWYGFTNSAGGAIQSQSAPCYYFNLTGAAGTILALRYLNNDVGSISVSGTGTAFNTTSDARLKNIVDDVLNTGLLIDAIAPMAFDWKKTGERDFGFIAQDLHKVIPRAVHVGSDADPGDDLASAKVGEEGFSPWGVDNSKLVPILWAEIRELRRRLEVANL